jgi:hypothetical protein
VNLVEHVQRLLPDTGCVVAGDASGCMLIGECMPARSLLRLVQGGSTSKAYSAVHEALRGSEQTPNTHMHTFSAAAASRQLTYAEAGRVVCAFCCGLVQLGLSTTLALQAYIHSTQAAVLTCLCARLMPRGRMSTRKPGVALGLMCTGTLPVTWARGKGWGLLTHHCTALRACSKA